MPALLSSSYEQRCCVIIVRLEYSTCEPIDARIRGMGSFITSRPIPRAGCVPTVVLNDVFELIAHEKHICRHVRKMKPNIGVVHAIVLKHCAFGGTLSAS